MVVGETKKKESHDFFWQRESRNFKSDTVKKTSARLPSEGLAIIKNKKTCEEAQQGKISCILLTAFIGIGKLSS